MVGDVHRGTYSTTTVERWCAPNRSNFGAPTVLFIIYFHLTRTATSSATIASGETLLFHCSHSQSQRKGTINTGDRPYTINTNRESKVSRRRPSGHGRASAVPGSVCFWGILGTGGAGAERCREGQPTDIHRQQCERTAFPSQLTARPESSMRSSPMSSWQSN